MNDGDDVLSLQSCGNERMSCGNGLKNHGNDLKSCGNEKKKTMNCANAWMIRFVNPNRRIIRRASSFCYHAENNICWCNNGSSYSNNRPF